jgi:glycosyltransferase involved in cell wall biosynthesis
MSLQNSPQPKFNDVATPDDGLPILVTRRCSTQPTPEGELAAGLSELESIIGQELAESARKNTPSQTTTSQTAPAASRALEKLIIQIPCYNEAETLGITLDALPREIDGIESVEWLIIDDGSQDATVAVAKQHGVDHVVKLPKNQGLARAFQAGLNECLRLGADVIVNTDADNQYCADDIQNLVDPIVRGEAELVIGARPISETSHFSFLKKKLQKLGSFVVRQVSQADVTDAPSGFRAITRKTAMRLNVFSDYTYTLETIIQAGQNSFAVKSVPIRTNADLRPSRLLKSISSYVTRSAMTIVRIFMTYRPLHFFGIPGGALCMGSLFLCLRYLAFFVLDGGAGHVQSLILAAITMGAGLLFVVVGLLGDLISVNRKLMEKVDYRLAVLDDRITNRLLNQSDTNQQQRAEAKTGDQNSSEHSTRSQ